MQHGNPAGRARWRDVLRDATASIVSPAPVRGALRRLARARLLPTTVQVHLPLRGTVPIRLFDGPEFSMESTPLNVVVRQLYFDGQDAQEPETLRPFSRLVDDVEVFVDVGANQGIFTLLAATRNPRLRVLAFEPNPQVFAVLESNVARNHLADRVELSRRALSNEGGIVQFELPVHPFAAHGQLTAVGSLDDASSVDCEAACLDDVVGSHRVDLVKIDVEGAEALVLEGARRTLTRWHPLLIIEVLDGSNEGVEAMLRDLDYTFYWLTRRGAVRRERLVPDPERRERNYLCVPASARETVLGRIDVVGQR